MKRVTSTYDKPMVVVYFARRNQRTSVNLLPRQELCTQLEDWQVTPELETLRRKSLISIEEVLAVKAEIVTQPSVKEHPAQADDVETTDADRSYDAELEAQLIETDTK